MRRPRYRRRPTPREGFSVPLRPHMGPPPGPEILPWYWHPNREGAQPPPAAFAAQLQRIDSELGVVFSPVHERWLVWVKNPRITHELCRGWQLLFLWEHPTTHEFLPLNELLFHNLMLVDATRFANAKEYFDRIQADIQQRRDARNKTLNDERHDMQREFIKSTEISSAGKGNKFSLYQDGTVVPSQADANWRAETRHRRLPSALIQQEKDDREKREYGR